MRRNTLALAVLVTLAHPVIALAHGSGHGHDASGAPPVLHVGTAYDSCYFDLHPELTQQQFRTFTAEGASVVRFQQLGAASGLGAGTWSLTLGQGFTPINDAKGAWNNTFSHPDADHYLGSLQRIPRLALRYGVTGGLDVGVWGTINPQANYGFVGVDAKLTVLDGEVAAVPVHLAVRPSATTMLGPSEVWLGNAALDVTAGVTIAGLSPYVGVGATVGMAIETSDDVTLRPAVTLSPAALAGIVYRIWHLRLGAEAAWSSIPTYGVVVGADL